MIACYNNSFEVVELLSENFTDIIDQKDINRWTLNNCLKKDTKKVVAHYIK